MPEPKDGEKWICQVAVELEWDALEGVWLVPQYPQAIGEIVPLRRLEDDD